MDIARTDFAQFRTRRRALVVTAIAATIVAAAFALSRIEPAVPGVPRAAVWTARVARGTMLRDVRGAGVLTPVDVRWVPAEVNARVERVVVLAGAVVQPDSILLVLSSPEIEQSAVDAELTAQSAEQDLARATVEAESEKLAQEAVAASANAAAEEAVRRLRVEEELARQGLTSQVNLDLARTRATELSIRQRIEGQRIDTSRRAAGAKVAIAQSRLRQLRALADLRRRQRDALTVRAGMAGIVQQVPVEAGQQVNAGTVLAKVADPGNLKAALKIPETQARDIVIGQKVSIDTRNGITEGTVARIDPAVQNGTVTVDVALPRKLPKGARPDLTVEGRIELDRLENVLHVARPLSVEEDGATTLFRVDADGAAARTRVGIGRISASSVEITSGLNEGDEVIVSDTSQWSGHDRIRIE